MYSAMMYEQSHEVFYIFLPYTHTLYSIIYQYLFMYIYYTSTILYTLDIMNK